MPVRPSEQQIRRLVEIYRQAVRRLAVGFVGALDIGKGRIFNQMQQMLQMLQQMDRQATNWARRNIAGVYRASQRATAKELAAVGLSKKEVANAAAFSVINDEAVQALLLDPDTGFLSGMRSASAQIRQRMAQIQRQATILVQQQRVIDETIARVGILQGENLDQVKRALVDELLSQKNAADLVWRPKLARLGSGHIFANLARLPYVRGPSGREFRLDRYAELVARTKTRQAVTLAQRHKLMQHGEALVMISGNLSKDDDACNLYVGRVFALTAEASKEFGVAHVDQLPNGGTPFHPNCTHTEVPYFVEFETEKEKSRALTRPPRWALGRPFGEVQKLYRRKGGTRFARASNPNFAFAQNSGGRRRSLARRGR